MDYSFNAEVATRYGVQEAVFLHNLYWWIAKNEANGRHHYDGRTWTYNSMAAFAKLFPFFSEKQIRRIIQKLLDDGALLVGNYNEDRRDRTQWYALSDEILSFYTVPKRADCKCPSGQMQPTQTGKCIYDTDNKQADDNNTHNTHAREERPGSGKEPAASDEPETFLTYARIRSVCQKHAPTIWARTEEKINQNGTALAGRLEGTVAEIDWIRNERDIVALFAHAEKTYAARPKYAACDALWVLNNHRKVMATEEDAPAPAKTADKPEAPVKARPAYDEYNARFKV